MPLNSNFWRIKLRFVDFLFYIIVKGNNFASMKDTLLTLDKQDVLNFGKYDGPNVVI